MMHTIEVDEATAKALKTLAAQRGISVPELLAELVSFNSDLVSARSEEIAELDRRWKSIEEGCATVPNDKVVGWLRTWGTSAFRPWHEQ
jgi:predicted transcriptional regulator